MSQYVDFAGRKIHYRDCGSGKPVVLLHGFLESLSIWDDFTQWLCDEFRVITIDLPGHGRSDILEEEHSMELMAEAVHHVLQDLKIMECVMAGHSMGGYVTLAFAERYADLLKGIVLFHSHAAEDTPEARSVRERTIEIVKSDHKSFIWQFIPNLFAPENVEKHVPEIETLRREASGISHKSIIAALEGMKNRSDKESFLSTTDLPVLFIIGKKDSRIDAEKVLRQALLPGYSEVLILERTGHMGYIEAKKETRTMLRDFIRKTQ